MRLKGQGKGRRGCACGSPFSQDMFVGHREQPGNVGHRAVTRATSHLHLGGDPAPAWGDHDKSLGEIWEAGVIRRELI